MKDKSSNPTVLKLAQKTPDKTQTTNINNPNLNYTYTKQQKKKLS